jgi:hypothetical protein
MTFVIIAFGALMLIAGIIIIINPENIFGLLNKHIDKLVTQIIAVVLRLILGVILIHQSDVSRFPIAIETLGWLSIVGALILTAMGRNNFIRLMSWALSLAKPYGRIGGVIAGCLGAFLAYAFI